MLGNRRVMRAAVICACLSFGLLSGCVDYAAARQRGIDSAKQQCESERKQFQLVSVRNDTEHQAAVVTAHCLGPGDPGYVPVTPSK